MEEHVEDKGRGRSRSRSRSPVGERPAHATGSRVRTESDEELEAEIREEWAEEEREAEREGRKVRIESGYPTPSDLEDEEAEEKEKGLSHEMAMGEPEGGEEKGRAPIRAQTPQKVTKKEREMHNLTHTPFRPWCRFCVRARGRNMQHMRKKDGADKELEVPRMSIDYFFMSDEDHKASENPMMVMVDESTGEKYARATGCKGLGQNGELDWLVKDMVAELKSWGHAGGESGHIIMKSDNENAIQAVRDAVSKLLGGRVTPEGPPRGESKSNGTVEEAGKTVREFTRVFKEQVEELAGVVLSPGDIIVQWMIRWAAMNCSRYLVGNDGRTAYERRRGRPCRIPVAEFAERVWYKQLRENKERKDKFMSEWQEGIWLGHGRSSNETWIGTREGVVRAYAIRRQPENERWDGKLIQEMKGTPSRPDPTKPGLDVPIKVRFDPVVEATPERMVEARSEVEPRRMQIRDRILKKYGYTEGCEGCSYKSAGLRDQRGHNEACRQRIEKAMEEDEDDKRIRERERKRKEKHEEAEDAKRKEDEEYKQNEEIAKQVEANIQK